jgi:hypothetical protein
VTRDTEPDMNYISQEAAYEVSVAEAEDIRSTRFVSTWELSLRSCG